MTQSIKKTYYTGDLTDDPSGFHAYFLTDTPKLTKATQKAYMAIRGSDGVRPTTLNDWVVNDANFTLNDAHISQAKKATKAMKIKIKELNEKSPEATMDIAAHSLGTMVSVQGLANLSSKELDKIGQVVLFDGPDTRKSLVKMGLSEEQIAKVSSKITYYLNPFDAVAMLNRQGTIARLPGDDDNWNKREEGPAVGTDNIVVPLHYTTFFDSTKSSHDFGNFQISNYESDEKKRGAILTASESYHPELLRAAEKLARLTAKVIDHAKQNGYSIPEKVVLSGSSAAFVAWAATIYFNFDKEYKEIVETARQEGIEWSRKAIPGYQEQLRKGGLSDGDRILVRAQLLQTAAQLAITEVEDKVNKVKEAIAAKKESIENMVNGTRRTAETMVSYLSSAEVAALLVDLEMVDVWDEQVESDALSSANKFNTAIAQLGTTLNRATQDFSQVDNQQAEAFDNLLQDTKKNWRA